MPNHEVIKGPLVARRLVTTSRPSSRVVVIGLMLFGGGSEADFRGERHPAAVFEVQRGGSLVEALARLKHALDRWNIYGLYLVITEEKNVDRARKICGFCRVG